MMPNSILSKKKKDLQTALLILLLLLGASCSRHQVVQFGICADVHKDIMHDADQRLQAFVSEMNEKDVDFIIQLGDFTQPQDYNASFMNIWNSFEGPAYHVLGNHEMDNSQGEKFSREYTANYLDMPAQYYSFEESGYHFVVLDGNDEKDPPQEGYAHYVGAEQMAWLKKDLAQTELPVVIFSHQSFEDPKGVENAVEVRKILEEANLESGKKKVIACFSGHHHIDYSTSINGITYIQINSMSYFWMGGDYLQVRYSKEIDEQFPYIKYTAPYKEPLFAMVEIDSRGVIRITGRESTWVGPDPWELGYPETNREKITPQITSKELEF
ncbi:MAG: metallophosphoesterase [Bacteroidota bacterium]